MIGAGDWSDTGRTFDAVKLRYEGGFGWVDAFSSHVVLPQQGSFDEGNK